MSVIRILRSFVHDGSLCIIDANGRRHLVGDGSPPVAVARLATWSSNYTLAINPTLSFGEAYMDGRLVIEEGGLYDFLEVIVRNHSAPGGSRWLDVLKRLRRGLKQANPVRRARRNVERHYDLPPDLYEIFLDADRQYSCAYFKTPHDSLEAAQANKKRHIAAKLLLDRPGLRVLDIGSGWGGLGIYLAETFGADVVGVTLSREQHAYSQERAARSPARDRIRFELRDYRELSESYDRIVSVGMFEHVGKKNYKEFFRHLHELLAEDGVALLHSIGYPNEPGPINPFIQKYVFPGADLPSLSEVFQAVEPTGLWATDIEILRIHYADTLRCWRDRFMAEADRFRTQYGPEFVRMWEFYLTSCEVGFRCSTNMVFQMQLARRSDALPLTRDYMLDTERDLEAAEAAQPGRVRPPLRTI